MAEKKSKNLFLVGDSTIDNLVWVDKKEDCIHSKLIERLPEFEITNFSADGFTSQNVLDGACPNISRSQRRKIGDPFPDEDHFAPLVYLESTALSLEKEHYCVLSIGGNDIREILGSMGKLQHKNWSLSSELSKDCPVDCGFSSKVDSHVTISTSAGPRCKPLRGLQSDENSSFWT